MKIRHSAIKYICLVLVVALVFGFAALFIRRNGFISSSEVISSKTVLSEDNLDSLSNTIGIQLNPSIENHRELIDRFDKIAVCANSLPSADNRDFATKNKDVPIKIYTQKSDSTKSDKHYTLTLIEGLYSDKNRVKAVLQIDFIKSPLLFAQTKLSLDSVSTTITEPKQLLVRYGDGDTWIKSSVLNSETKVSYYPHFLTTFDGADNFAQANNVQFWFDCTYDKNLENGSLVRINLATGSDNVMFDWIYYNK